MTLSDRLQEVIDDQPHQTERKFIPTDLLLEAIVFIRAFEGCREAIDCLTRGEIT